MIENKGSQGGVKSARQKTENGKGKAARAKRKAEQVEKWQESCTERFCERGVENARFMIADFKMWLSPAVVLVEFAHGA